MNEPARIHLRESCPDCIEYFDLFEATGWNKDYGLTAQELYDAVRGSWYFLAAYDEGRLVGTGRVISDGVFHALIVDVIVRPDYQGRGLGTMIMQRLLDRCRSGRIRDVQLFCARGKSGFYRQLGFVARPEDSPGMDFKAPTELP